MPKFIPNPNPFPNYFWSHGGPPFLYGKPELGDVGAWKTIKALGTKIKEWSPDYIIVVSAHWQARAGNTIEIGVPEGDKENGIIYDFRGFPSYMYEEEFHTKNSYTIAKQIKEQLQQDGFKSGLAHRGLDHGVWVPLKFAFSDYNKLTTAKYEGGLDLPDTAVIQVSLPYDETDFNSVHKLGESLEKFRNQSVWDESKQRYASGLVIYSGMTVHNLGDLWKPDIPSSQYAQPFSDLLTEALESENPYERLQNIQTQHRSLLYQAHPSLEHFVPIVAATATEDKEVKELYNKIEGCVAWGVYQFGKDYQEAKL